MTVTRYKPVCDVVVATVTAYNAADPGGEYVAWRDYEALLPYLHHKPECDYIVETLPCTCGLNAILSADAGRRE